MDVNSIHSVELIRNEKLKNGTSVKTYSAFLADSELGQSPLAQVVGIDPGQVNMGIAWIVRHLVQCHQIELPRTEDTVERVVQVIEVVEELLDGLVIDRACVEQAAYGALYGQSTLAEARTAAVVGLLKLSAQRIEVVPPRKIRKSVFGDGKIKAEEVWFYAFGKEGKDAASALGCALYAYSQLNII